MSSLRIPLLARALTALALALTAAAADATPVRTARPAASQPPARAWATRDQLRECLDLEAALKTRRDAVDAAASAHDEKFNRVEAENAKLLEAQAQLDHDSEAAVHAYNLMVADHNAHVRELNQDAEASQAASDAYNADLQAVNRKCTPLAYRVEDMDAVLKERRKAAQETPK